MRTGPNVGNICTRVIAIVLMSLFGPALLLASALQDGEPVQIVEPKADAVVLGVQKVSVALAPNLARSLARLDFYVDGRLVGTRTASPYIFDVDFGATPEAHVVEVIATDDGGRSASARVTTRALKVDYDASVREVLVPVAATEPGGGFRAGLGRTDFRAYDGTVAIGIKDVWVVDMPLRVAVLFDSSSSMYERVHAARRVLDTLVGELKREDQASLSSFLAEPRRLLAASGSHSDLLRLSHELRVSHLGFTGIFDSAGGILDAEFAGVDPRWADVLVVVTDGLDTVSQRRPEDVAQDAKTRGVPLLVIAVRSPDDEAEAELPAEERLAHRRLAEWAKLTRGRALFTSSGRDLDREVSAALKDARTRYMLSLEPPGDADVIEVLRIEPVASDLEIWYPPQTLKRSSTGMD